MSTRCSGPKGAEEHCPRGTHPQPRGFRSCGLGETKRQCISPAHARTHTHHRDRMPTYVWCLIIYAALRRLDLGQQLRRQPWMSGLGRHRILTTVVLAGLWGATPCTPQSQCIRIGISATGPTPLPVLLGRSVPSAAGPHFVECDNRLDSVVAVVPEYRISPVFANCGPRRPPHSRRRAVAGAASPLHP